MPITITNKQDKDTSWKQADSDNWTVYYYPKQGCGQFEHKFREISGGLWFNEDKELVDCDGVYDLPEGVKELIRAMGFFVSDVF